jgi:hypothetical protein
VIVVAFVTGVTRVAVLCVAGVVVSVIGAVGVIHARNASTPGGYCQDGRVVVVFTRGSYSSPVTTDRPHPYPRLVVPFMLIIAVTDIVIMGLVSELIAARVIGAAAVGAAAVSIMLSRDARRWWVPALSGIANLILNIAVLMTVGLTGAEGTLLVLASIAALAVTLALVPGASDGATEAGTYGFRGPDTHR